MSKNNSLRKSEQLKAVEKVIAKKKEELAKQKELKLKFEQISQSHRSASTVPQLNAIPSQQQATSIEITEIPPQDLTATNKSQGLKLEEIRVPPVASLAGSSIKVPTTKDQLIELVAANGDGYEENLIKQFNRNDLCQPLRFLFDKTSTEYLNYRQSVIERRTADGKRKDELQYETFRNTPSGSRAALEPKIFGSTQESKAKTVTIIRNDDSESTNSDTETWKEAKERNLKSLKDKAITSRTRKHREISTSDSSDDEHRDGDQSEFYDRKFKMSSASSSASSSNSKKIVADVQKKVEQASEKSSESSSRPPKRKKSRWGEAPAAPTPEVSISPVQAVSGPPKLTAITRTDPALLQYARQNFGSTNLTEEDWKKAEEHYKINLLYQDMQRKRQELDKLAKNGKFKFEYDSDEDVKGGTWEHKLRSQEMEATLKWAEALNKQCEGKHHIGDFLPPEELKKFMEKYESKGDAQPDVSDYKEFKLKEDNIGYQMLQRLGWKGEGTSLGASGSGITEPINKAAQRDNHQGLGANEVEAPNENDNEFDVYRKRMMLAYRFRPNPLNNPRRAYY